MLGLFADQSFNSDQFEVIIVVDSPEAKYSDKYKQVFAGSKVKHLHPVFNEENLGIARARDNGLKHADGKYILVMDDDMIIDEDFLQGYYDVVIDNPQAIICGDIQHGNVETQFQRYLTTSRTYFGYQGLVHGEECSYDYLFTGNTCIPRSAFADISFHEGVHKGKGAKVYGYEDFILAYRLHLKGYTFVYNKVSSAIHDEYPTLPSVLGRKYKAGISSISVHNIYPELDKKIHYTPALKYLPVRVIPGAWLWKALEPLLAITTRIPGMQIIYKILLMYAFATGAAKGLNQ